MKAKKIERFWESITPSKNSNSPTPRGKKRSDSSKIPARLVGWGDESVKKKRSQSDFYQRRGER